MVRMAPFSVQWTVAQQMRHAVLGGTAAAGQIFDVLFVDVLPALVAVVAAGHELLAHGGVYL